MAAHLEDRVLLPSARSLRQFSTRMVLRSQIDVTKSDASFAILAGDIAIYVQIRVKCTTICLKELLKLSRR